MSVVPPWSASDAGAVLRPAPSVGWMLGCSLWLLPVVLGLGTTSWIGFLVIGVLALRIRWIVLAALQFVVLLSSGMSFIDLVQFPLRVTSGYLMPLDLPILVLYVASLAYALWANRVWLRILWGRRERGERMLGRGGRPAAGTAAVPAPAAGGEGSPVAVAAEAPPVAPADEAERAAWIQRLADDVRAVADGGAADAAAAPVSVPAPSPTVLPPTVPPPTVLPVTVLPGTLPHGPLDVHTASVDQLAAIPAIGPDRAALLVAARGVRPIDSIDDVVEILELPAADLIRVRPYLAF